VPSAARDEHSIPLAAAALQFPFGSDIISSVIPGPRSKSELEQIVEWFKASVPHQFRASLTSKCLIHEAAPVPDSR
jgi:D-threo-aldose 1-dehydrogenase